MDIKDRIAAMTVDLGELKIEPCVRFGADSAQRHSHGFGVLVDGVPLAEVVIRPRDAEQVKIDLFAAVLHGLLSGSESRVADATERLENLRVACKGKDALIAHLREQLSHFERSARAARGPFYAAEDGQGQVWLLGRPSWAAFGLGFKNWRDLASGFPGLRPCGVVQGEAADERALFVVMRPIADLPE